MPHPISISYTKQRHSLAFKYSKWYYNTQKLILAQNYRTCCDNSSQVRVFHDGKKKKKRFSRPYLTKWLGLWPTLSIPLCSSSKKIPTGREMGLKYSTGMPSFAKAVSKRTKAKWQKVSVTNECYLMDTEESKFTLEWKHSIHFFNLAIHQVVDKCVYINMCIYMYIEKWRKSKQKNMIKYFSSEGKGILFINGCHLTYFWTWRILWWNLNHKEIGVP